MSYLIEAGTVGFHSQSTHTYNFTLPHRRPPFVSCLHTGSQNGGTEFYIRDLTATSVTFKASNSFSGSVNFHAISTTSGHYEEFFTNPYNSVSGYLTGTTAPLFWEVPNNSTLNFTTQFSLVFWYKSFTLGPTTARAIIGKWHGPIVNDGSTSCAYTIQRDSTDSAEMTAAVGSSGGAAGSNRYRSDDADQVVNTWYHMAMTYNGTLANALRISMYQNARNLSSTIFCTITASIQESPWGVTPPGNFRIGGSKGLTGVHSGAFDEVQVYNTQLTKAQVATLYNSGVAIDPRDLSTNSNLVSYWRMGEGSDTTSVPTLFDVKGTNNGVFMSGSAGLYRSEVGTT